MSTGHGSAVSYGTSGITLDLVSYDAPERTVDDIEEPHLGLAAGVGMPMSPSEIVKNGEYVFHHVNDMDTDITLRVKETITVTKPNTGSTSATEVFTGYIKSVGEDSMETGTRNMLNVTVVVDGDITVTPGT